MNDYCGWDKGTVERDASSNHNDGVFNMLVKKLPWGKLWVVGQTHSFDVVREIVEPRKAVPLAYYKKRTAIVYILRGRGKCCGKTIKKGDLLKFKPKEKHELINTTDKNLEFIHICIPPYDSEDFFKCE